MRDLGWILGCDTSACKMVQESYIIELAIVIKAIRWNQDIHKPIAYIIFEYSWLLQ
jgi:hypothetical protein